MNLPTEEQLEEFVKQEPAGLLVAYGPNQIQVRFWQNPNPTEKVLWENFIHGVVQTAINKHGLTKKQIIKLIERVVK